ncbi:MAG: PAS domain S-box protein [Pyrinomonadaceae bacterium]
MRKGEDATVQESEGKYRMLTEQASDGIHTYDLQGNFLYVNQRLCKMLGYRQEELLRLNVQDLVPPEELIATPIRFDDLRSGKTIISERTLRRKDGKLIPVEISGRMLADGVLQAIIRDTSARKHTEEMLRNSERFAYSTLDALTEHIVVLEQAGTIIATNKAWRDFARTNRAEMGQTCEGANYLTVCDRSSADGCHEATEFAAGIRAVLKNERDEFSLEYPCHSPGMERWFTSRVTCFNDRTRIVVAHENITKRKEIEEKLRQSEEWLRAIFETSRDGILVEDGNTIVYINKAYAELFGYDRVEELLGKSVSIVVSPGDKERMLEFGRRRLHGEKPPTIYEFKGQRKEGTLIDLEASVSTPTIGGKVYITTAIRDIAERKRATAALQQIHDQLERRVEERTAELARINTELEAEIAERRRGEEARTELLRRLATAREEERHRIARELHDQMGQHLTALMLGLKSLDSISYGRQPALEQLRDLEELTNQIVREVHILAWELRPTALDDLGLPTALNTYLEDWGERAKVSVSFLSTGLEDRRLPPHVETTLYRIVQEALTNILKHAQANRVSVVLTLRHHNIGVVVEDDGKGFDVESMWAAPIEARRLGLLGMRERMVLAGGTLSIESTPNVGTTVFVSIPLAN